MLIVRRAAFFLLITCNLFPVRAYSLTESGAVQLSLRVGSGAGLNELQVLLPLSKKQAISNYLNDNDNDPDFLIPECAQNLLRPYSEIKSFTDIERQTFRKNQNRCKQSLKQAYAQHLVESSAGAALMHRMELFWHNHFTSSLTKVPHAALIYNQHSTIHKFSLGNFRVLLHSMLLDPAMLMYLDNNKNFKARPNENLARELLELFTLGVGEYSEKDVKEVARALTGMSIDPRYYTPRFYPERHDYGEKTILGESGVFGVDAVVEILLKQKQTAKHITRKLWLEFVSTEDDAEIERLSERFYKDWNIRRLVRGILMSKAFWNDAGKMTKSPLELVVGGSRLLPGMVPSESVPALLRRMEQDLFDPPNVKGWPSGNDWITGQTYIERIKFGELLTRGLQPQRYEKELAFICADGGPAKLAALPVELASATTPSLGVQDDTAGVVPAETMVLSMANKEAAVVDGDEASRADYRDLSECVDALSNLLENPVWQLK
ncbi:DUF1800 domain-containing protein [Zhongshania guokunii]|uniref:DUF1800 domain-containing protein n=1 Tax=Zhongshania guokunii TaxID=641783 RepID=A0ABV3U537_9GAMM